jgi:hypothetical protein
LSAEHIKSSPDEDIPAKKKPRLLASPLLAIVVAADADTLNAPPDASVAVTSPNTGTDLATVSPMQPNVGAVRAPTRRPWTPEEHRKLANAVERTCKKKYGEEYRTDWVVIAVLVPGRTKAQCCDRWHNVLHSKSDETTARAGKWTTDEDITLKDAVEKYNGADWVAIAALVLGRMKKTVYTQMARFPARKERGHFCTQG